MDRTLDDTLPTTAAAAEDTELVGCVSTEALLVRSTGIAAPSAKPVSYTSGSSIEQCTGDDWSFRSPSFDVFITPFRGRWIDIRSGVSGLYRTHGSGNNLGILGSTLMPEHSFAGVELPSACWTVSTSGDWGNVDLCVRLLWCLRFLPLRTDSGVSCASVLSLDAADTQELSSLSGVTLSIERSVHGLSLLAVGVSTLLRSLRTMQRSSELGGVNNRLLTANSAEGVCDGKTEWFCHRTGVPPWDSRPAAAVGCDAPPTASTSWKHNRLEFYI